MWALEIVIVINCRIQQQNNLRPGQKDRNDNNSKVSSGDDFIYDRDINYLLVYNQCLLQECQDCSLVNSVVYQKMVSIAGNIHCADIDDSLTDVFPHCSQVSSMIITPAQLSVTSCVVAHHRAVVTVAVARMRGARRRQHWSRRCALEVVILSRVVLSVSGTMSVVRPEQ